MLILAIGISCFWLFLLLYGRYAKGIPSRETIKLLIAKKHALKLGQRAPNDGEEAGGKSSKKRRKEQKLPATYMYIPAYSLYELARLEQRAMTLLHLLHSYLMQLYRYQWSFEGTVFFLNEAIGQALLLIVVGSWLALAAQEWAIYGVFGVIAIVVVVNVIQTAKKMMNERRRLILMELPKLLTRITLLVGAGETLLQAFIKCIHNKQTSQHPLYVEWREAVYQLNNGVAFAEVVERLNRNCSLQQMSLLTTYMLLSYRKGGEHFISSVQELNLTLWETRKHIARTKGEEGSSKMIFPLVGILLLVMVLIVTPAIMMMNNL